MDSFLHNHQAALDSQREDDAIRDLQDAGIYPDPDYDEAYDHLSEKYPDYSDETLDRMATSLVQGNFDDYYEPTDYE